MTKLYCSSWFGTDGAQAPRICDEFSENIIDDRLISSQNIPPSTSPSYDVLYIRHVCIFVIFVSRCICGLPRWQRPARLHPWTVQMAKQGKQKFCNKCWIQQVLSGCVPHVGAGGPTRWRRRRASLTSAAPPHCEGIQGRCGAPRCGGDRSWIWLPTVLSHLAAPHGEGIQTRGFAGSVQSFPSLSPLLHPFLVRFVPLFFCGASFIISGAVYQWLYKMSTPIYAAAATSWLLEFSILFFNFSRYFSNFVKYSSVSTPMNFWISLLVEFFSIYVSTAKET